MTETLPFGALPSLAEDIHARIFSLDRVGDGLCLSADTKVLACDTSVAPLLLSLRAALMVHVADYAADRVFLHAGVVAWEGSALVFPGRSFAGKSTLVAELVRAGAVYFSDEYAVLDSQGCVHPYGRDLQMRRPGSAQQTPVPVASLHGTLGHGPAHVSHVLFVEYAPTAVWSPRSLTSGAAVLEMLSHTIPVQRTPARVLSTLAAMMQTATALQSPRGEASQAVRQILDAVSAGVSA